MRMCNAVHNKMKLTIETAVVISGPPEAPATSLTRPLGSVKITGLMGDWGVFPGLIKLLLEGLKYYQG